MPDRTRKSPASKVKTQGVTNIAPRSGANLFYRVFFRGLVSFESPLEAFRLPDRGIEMIEPSPSDFGLFFQNSKLSSFVAILNVIF